jgi:hypothetical protein
MWDSDDIDYHLTPRGWVEGYKRPPDALASWHLSLRQPSGWAPPDRFWDRTWERPGADAAVLAALYRRFPRPGTKPATAISPHELGPLPIPKVWSPINFGKFYELGKTLPQIVLSDPDWFFHMHEQDAFLGSLRSEAQGVARKATQIRIPGKSPTEFKVQYYLTEDTGKFWYIDVVRVDDPLPLDVRFERRDFLDLSYPRRRQYDKRGGRRIIEQLKIYVFGNACRRFTKAVCERFFNNPKNFGYRDGERS